MLIYYNPPQGVDKFAQVCFFFFPSLILFPTRAARFNCLGLIHFHGATRTGLLPTFFAIPGPIAIVLTLVTASIL